MTATVRLSAKYFTFENSATRPIYIFVVLVHLLLYFGTAPLSPCLSYRDDDDDDDDDNDDVYSPAMS